MPVLTITGNELVSGLTNEFMTIMTVEIAEMTKQMVSTFFSRDNAIHLLSQA